MTYQQTIKYPATLTGNALNSGLPVTIKISPAPPNSGIRFFPAFGHKYGVIKSNCYNINSCILSTNISNDQETIRTIEHLLSALHANHIDNADITLSGGNEIPMFDGSAEPLYHLIRSAGLQIEDEPRKYIEVSEPITIYEPNKSIKIEPYDGLIIDCTISFDHPEIKTQRIIYDMDKYNYQEDVSRARTFGFYNQIKQLQERGYLKGGGIDSAIILNDTDIINPPLRYDDEFVRHKLLDLIGDIYVNGAIKGYITSYCSGHCLNNKLMRVISERTI